jgi:hypothetical protein
MNPTTHATLSDPELVAAREAGLARLADLFDGKPAAQAMALNGVMRLTEDVGPVWERWLDEALDALAAQAERMQDARVFRPLIVNYNPHGVHFTDSLFGAHVFRMEDGSWQAHTLSTPIGMLRMPDLDSLPVWRDACDCALAFVELNVPAVIFGLPTIASVLNIAVNLYGQGILIAMIEQPDAARHDLKVINDLLCQMHRWYRAHIPPEQLQGIVPDGRCQPREHGQLCGCTTQLLSPWLYDEFIAPLDDELLSVYPRGGMIHLCGTHAQHIPVWREMKSLRAVQMNDRAAEDLSLYFDGLREDQILYVNPCEKMPVERIMEITGGRRVVVVADVPGPLPVRQRAPAASRN